MSDDPVNLQTSREAIVSLNFDDGHGCLVRTAEPILRDRGLRGSFFTPVERVHVPPANPENLSVDDMAHLIELGHEVGSHALHHRRLAELPPEEALVEIRDSKSWLRERGISVTSFAYPIASVNETLKGYVQDFYTCGRTTRNELELNRRPFERYELRSFRVEFPQHTPAVVKACIDQALAEQAWLILLFHHVHPEAESYLDYSIDDFTEVCDYVVSTGVRCVTIREVMA